MLIITRFGFKTAAQFNLSCKFNLPDEVFMVRELESGVMGGGSGVIKHPRFLNAFNLPMSQHLLNTERWKKGSFCTAHHFLGSHIRKAGVHFAVWAPNAEAVSVVGNFNNWNADNNPMQRDDETGIWSAFVPRVRQGALYKFQLKSPGHPSPFLKSDPYARLMEVRPQTASIVYSLDGFNWDDELWLQERQHRPWQQRPLSIYEIHPGSWKRSEHDHFLNYRALADQLIPYVKSLGFTHIELLPIAEHPYDPSWGYQVNGFFAPTSRYGEPKDLMYFVNECHKHAIGVILDWVPAHFPKDESGLRQFDGSTLYEYADPRKREQKDWNTLIFDYGKAGVRNFLLSNARYWCEKFHIDGLRVDAVASMLYLDYSKQPGEWTPNKNGGNEHLEAIRFLQDVNDTLHQQFPGVLTFAEESTAWPGVTESTENGLGFDFKWNMGWMNDTLSYMGYNSEERSKNREKITFPMMYNHTENFVLPLSHDEVVHLKKPLLKKSGGNETEQFANLRLLLTYFYAHPGKKLLFMGNEFGETQEWAEHRALNWSLPERPPHAGIRKLVHDLNQLYRNEPALHQTDRKAAGFEWIETGQRIPSLFVFRRNAIKHTNHLLCAFNFSGDSVDYTEPRIFSDFQYQLILNSDSKYYEGGNFGNLSAQHIHIAPFSGLIFKPV